MDPQTGLRVARELDMIFWFGILASAVGGRMFAGSLGFPILLLGNLRFVGGIGLILTGVRGWEWRVGLLLALEAYTAATSSMFHGLLLWMAMVAALSSTGQNSPGSPFSVFCDRWVGPVVRFAGRQMADASRPLVWGVQDGHGL